MKKNNSYLARDEIDLSDLIKLFWKEKILILSISIIFGFAGYLYSSFQPQESKIEIKLKNPPTELFEPYTFISNNSSSITTNTTNTNTTNTNNTNTNNIAGNFISYFKLNFLSLDNLQSFVDESREFDNFKAYLKSRNISAKKYFKIGEVKEKNLVIPNIYFLVYPKKIDGNLFFNNYVEFTKKKTALELKKNLKLSIENNVTILENALDKAKLINLEYPIIRSMTNSNQVINEPQDLFYKGSKIISQEIIYLKKLLIKLENEQFNFEIILDKSSNYSDNTTPNFSHFVIGLIIGLFLSLVIIFFKSIFKE
jgi:LPS O-antigen subunit length determinant protein (WzzB/FepE family)